MNAFIEITITILIAIIISALLLLVVIFDGIPETKRQRDTIYYYRAQENIKEILGKKQDKRIRDYAKQQYNRKWSSYYNPWR